MTFLCPNRSQMSEVKYHTFIASTMLRALIEAQSIDKAEVWSQLPTAVHPEIEISETLDTTDRDQSRQGGLCPTQVI